MEACCLLPYMVLLLTLTGIVSCARRKYPNAESQVPCADGDNTLLKCYDCDSISEPSCGNPDDGDFRLYTHQAVYCPDGIVYCRTDEYFYNGTIVYDRQCAGYNPRQPECTVITDDKGIMRTVCYCNKHHCNQATSVTIATSITIATIVVLAVIMMKKTF